MTATSSSTLALAGRLRVLDDTALGAVLRARAVRDSSLGDFFDLAEKLLDSASVQTALAALDRPTLASLAALAELTGAHDGGEYADTAAIAARLDALGSIVAPETVAAQLATATAVGLAANDGDRFTTWQAVAEQLAEWPSLGLPDLAGLASAWVAPEHPEHSGDVDALAAERAFTTTMAVVEIVAEHQHEPAKELAKGGLSLPDAKRLAASAAVDLEEVTALHAIAVHAGLLALDSGHWLPTDDAAPWMLQSTPEVWSRLAAAWLHDLPRDIRHLLAGRTHDAWDSEFESLVAWLYPAGGEVLRERVAARIVAAELLGIIADTTPSTPGALLLDEGADAAAASMGRLLPREVEQVYLQHDLSIVSPGPLAPRLDARLRTMAIVESHALASSYRVSLDSVNRAFALGETAESITEFLAGISLTGIPQPLSYLIADAAQRYGLVRVGAAGDGSYVRSTDPNLLGALLVDQGLSALGLVRESDGRLLSRYDEQTVFWSLSEARYPVAAESTDGAVVSLGRRTRKAAVQQPVVDHTDSIIERLRQSGDETGKDNDRAWLERQLDAAVKARLTITVTVTVQDGSSVEYVLEPTGLGGGRLRARDRKADIERTLPLARITAVSSAV
jgi:hypothetical protein